MLYSSEKTIGVVSHESLGLKFSHVHSLLTGVDQSLILPLKDEYMSKEEVLQQLSNLSKIQKDELRIMAIFSGEIIGLSTFGYIKTGKNTGIIIFLIYERSTDRAFVVFNSEVVREWSRMVAIVDAIFRE
jgi:hypothetical protein